MYAYKQADFWKLLNLVEYKLGSKQETIELMAYSLVSFFIPLIFRQPQLLVGTVVNAVLILTALNLKNRNILPAIMLPSIAAAAGGYLFGGFTMYLVYMIPFIWLGNAIIVLAFKQFRLQKNKNFIVTLGISSLAKAGFLLGITLLLVSLSIVPAVFLTAMGLLQLTTALVGGVLAFTVQKVKKALL